MGKYKVGFHFSEYIAEDIAEESEEMKRVYRIVGVSPDVDVTGKHVYFVEYYINKNKRHYNTMWESEIDRRVLQFESDKKNVN